MAFQPKDFSGALFKNDRKERDTHPDYKGSALIDGIKYEVAAWVKETKDGRKYFSMAYKVIGEQEARSAPQRSGGQRTYREDGPDW